MACRNTINSENLGHDSVGKTMQLLLKSCKVYFDVFKYYISFYFKTMPIYS